MCNNNCTGCTCGTSMPNTITDDQLAEVSDMHSKIMNIQCDAVATAVPGALSSYYKHGYSDARHAAAEIALAGDAEIERLRAENAELLLQLAEVMRVLDSYKRDIERYAFVASCCEVVLPDCTVAEDSSDIDKAMGIEK